MGGSVACPSSTLGTVANTDANLLIYGLLQRAEFLAGRDSDGLHIARMARTPSETKKTTTLSIAAEFRRLRPGIQAERKSLISWAEQF